MEGKWGDHMVHMAYGEGEGDGRQKISAPLGVVGLCMVL
jgi:hypothetical protein